MYGGADDWGGTISDDLRRTKEKKGKKIELSLLFLTLADECDGASRGVGGRW